ncbi:Uncharacterised protein [Brucella melitensis]|nr:Uncharacterised protein [Brucella melitensis]
MAAPYPAAGAPDVDFIALQRLIMQQRHRLNIANHFFRLRHRLDIEKAQPLDIAHIAFNTRRSLIRRPSI